MQKNGSSSKAKHGKKAGEQLNFRKGKGNHTDARDIQTKSHTLLRAGSILLASVLWAACPLSIEDANAETANSDLYSGSVSTSVLNFVWHTQTKRSADNISMVSAVFGDKLGAENAPSNLKEDFVVFVSGAYAIRDGRVSEKLLTWLPVEARKKISRLDVGDKDCTIVPLEFQRDQSIFIVVENFLREDDEAERRCFLYGVRHALALPTDATNLLPSDQVLKETMADLEKLDGR